MMGAVMNHLHWCDSILHTNPIVARSKEMTENMMKQKTNLQQQIGLVNEQIQLYRVSILLQLHIHTLYTKFTRVPAYSIDGYCIAGSQKNAYWQLIIYPQGSYLDYLQV